MKHARFLLCLGLLATGCATSGDDDDPTVSGDVSLSSRCGQDAAVLTCAHNTALIGGRRVHWQVPLGDAPEGGWPAVVMFHGSFVSPTLWWAGIEGDPLGIHDQVATVRRLLDRGFAVITPQSGLLGFWDTNLPAYALIWNLAPDHAFMKALFEAIDGGAVGDVDGSRLYATGISSGGYMTSRMAVSYPGRFKALAVCSGSYATCSGPLCAVPDLPDAHPPTLFLHGDADLVVPISTMYKYNEALVAQGTPTRLAIHPGAGHRFLPEAVDEIAAWFAAWP